MTSKQEEKQKFYQDFNVKCNCTCGRRCGNCDLYYSGPNGRMMLMHARGLSIIASGIEAIGQATINLMKVVLNPDSRDSIK